MWSDQFGLRIQLVGDARAAAAVEIDARVDSEFVARYWSTEDGRLVAALAANRLRERSRHIRA